MFAFDLTRAFSLKREVPYTRVTHEASSLPTFDVYLTRSLLPCQSQNKVFAPHETKQERIKRLAEERKILLESQRLLEANLRSLQAEIARNNYPKVELSFDALDANPPEDPFNDLEGPPNSNVDIRTNAKNYISDEDAMDVDMPTSVTNNNYQPENFLDVIEKLESANKSLSDSNKRKYYIVYPSNSIEAIPQVSSKRARVEPASSEIPQSSSVNSNSSKGVSSSNNGVKLNENMTESSTRSGGSQVPLVSSSNPPHQTSKAPQERSDTSLSGPPISKKKSNEKPPSKKHSTLAKVDDALADVRALLGEDDATPTTPKPAKQKDGKKAKDIPDPDLSFLL